MTAIIEAAARALECLPGGDELHRDLALRVLSAVTPLIRAAALEEAAKVADFRGGLSPDPERIIAKQVAAAIRSLKERP
jgi:hypothetical protein